MQALSRRGALPYRRVKHSVATATQRLVISEHFEAITHARTHDSTLAWYRGVRTPYETRKYMETILYMSIY